MAMLGMIVSLMILLPDEPVASSSQNACAYVALALTIISIALRWSDRREQMGWRLTRQSAD